MQLLILVCIFIEPEFCCLSGPTVIVERNDTAAHDCLDMCYTDANCTMALHSAALSDCVLLSAPPVCTTDTILETYTMYKKKIDAGCPTFKRVDLHWTNAANVNVKLQ